MQVLEASCTRGVFEPMWRALGCLGLRVQSEQRMEAEMCRTLRNSKQVKLADAERGSGAGSQEQEAQMPGQGSQAWAGVVAQQ